MESRIERLCVEHGLSQDHERLIGKIARTLGFGLVRHRLELFGRHRSAESGRRKLDAPEAGTASLPPR